MLKTYQDNITSKLLALFGRGSVGGTGCMARRRVTRRWETFAGRSRFWCDGRAMTAPRPTLLGVTLALVTGTAALHLACDAPFLAARLSAAVPCVGAALTVFSVSCLLRTGLSDPGVLPRAAPAECPAPPAPRPPPRALEVLVRGRPVKLKYCFTCKMFRPPRASHCSLCDNCVDRFDHHCPWVGNCVGRRNYRSFYAFVVSLAFLAVWVFACAVAHLVLVARGAPGGIATALRSSPGSAVAAAICFLAVWSVLGLAGFHTYLASSDRTTNEDIKGSFSRRRGAADPNPYSRGNPCANCCYVLCGPMAPSLVDARGVLPDPPPPPLFVLQTTAPGAGPTLLGTPTYSELNERPRHAYTNHSLDEEPAAPCVAAPDPEVTVDGPLSARRLRQLVHTTMIDAALDLDEPEPPPHLRPP